MRADNIIDNDLQQLYSGAINWAAFADKTILIAGAGGFLPAYMVEALLFANAKNNLNLKVIALVRNESKAQKRFARYLSNPHLYIMPQDVCESVVYSDEIHYIVHAASQASPKYYGIDPVGTLSANLTGTINLLELAREKKVNAFLYFSSAEVYGQQNNGGIPVREDSFGSLDPAKVRSCYGESKRMGETICVSYAHQYKVDARIIRPFHTFGPGMDLNDGRVFVDFVANIVNGHNIEMKSDGSAKRAYCYITDAVEAYFKVLLEGETAVPYNVGNPDSVYSVLELANMLVELFSDKELQVVKHQQPVGVGYLASQVDAVVPDIERIKKLNWLPKVSAQDGFYRTVMSYSKDV